MAKLKAYWQFFPRVKGINSYKQILSLWYCVLCLPMEVHLACGSAVALIPPPPHPSHLVEDRTTIPNHVLPIHI